MLLSESTPPPPAETKAVPAGQVAVVDPRLNCASAVELNTSVNVFGVTAASAGAAAISTAPAATATAMPRSLMALPLFAREPARFGVAGPGYRRPGTPAVCL